MESTNNPNKINIYCFYCFFITYNTPQTFNLTLNNIVINTYDYSLVLPGCSKNIYIPKKRNSEISLFISLLDKINIIKTGYTQYGIPISEARLIPVIKKKVKPYIQNEYPRILYINPSLKVLAYNALWPYFKDITPTTKENPLPKKKSKRPKGTLGFINLISFIVPNKINNIDMIIPIGSIANPSQFNISKFTLQILL